MNGVTGIAFYGPKHSGKTTCADLAVAAGYTKLSLAGPVKDSAVAMLNAWLKDGGHEEFMTRDILDQHKDKTFVPLLQWLGTDWARKFLGRDTYWIDAFRWEALNTEGFVVCDDLRFPNEAQALHDDGFIIVRVLRNEDERQASLAAVGAGGIAGHASEVDLEAIEPDLTIHNTSLDALTLAVEYIIGMIEADDDDTVTEYVA